jgi:hypothetical protein
MPLLLRTLPPLPLSPPTLDATPTDDAPLRPSDAARLTALLLSPPLLLDGSLMPAAPSTSAMPASAVRVERQASTNASA